MLTKYLSKKYHNILQYYDSVPKLLKYFVSKHPEVLAYDIFEFFEDLHWTWCVRP
jgi:hypothetical protein